MAAGIGRLIVERAAPRGKFPWGAVFHRICRDLPGSAGAGAQAGPQALPARVALFAGVAFFGAYVAFARGLRDAGAFVEERGVGRGGGAAAEALKRAIKACADAQRGPPNAMRWCGCMRKAG